MRSLVHVLHGLHTRNNQQHFQSMVERLKMKLTSGRVYQDRIAYIEAANCALLLFIAAFT